MGKPLFEYEAFSLQFTSNLAYSLEEPVSSMQVFEETNAGIPRVQELGDKDITMINLNFSKINLVDRAALLDWLQNKVIWMANPFYYTNQDGLKRLVIAFTQEFNFPIDNYNFASGTIPLRVITA